jgi:hypothetical protein
MWAGIVLAALVAGDLAAEPQPATCPSSAEVAAELARVGAVDVPPPDIVVEDDRMRVVLRAADGTMLGSREVEAPASCHERATVAAVFVATWMGIWPEGANAASAPRPASVERSPAPPPPALGRRPEIGLAVLGVHDGNAAALGLTLEARARLVGKLGMFLAVNATSERDRAVGPARAGYLRPSLELGPTLRLGHGRWQGELAVAARLGLLVLRGRDLPVTHRTTRLVPGAAANARLVRAGLRWSPFAVVCVGHWLARQELTLDNQPATADLPRWEATAGLGLLWAP